MIRFSVIVLSMSRKTHDIIFRFISGKKCFKSSDILHTPYTTPHPSYTTNTFIYIYIIPCEPSRVAGGVRAPDMLWKGNGRKGKKCKGVLQWGFRREYLC
jgi:hypothetical protein